MMRICIALATLAALALAPTTEAAEDFVSAEALAKAGLSKYWQLELPLLDGQALRDVYRVDDTLYLGTNDGWVYAVDGATGVVRWVRQITRSGYHVRRPVHVGDHVCFLTPTDIQVYERLSGDPIARTQLNFAPGSSLATDGHRLFIGGLDRRLYALSVATRYRIWAVVTSSSITSTPATYGDWVFFANDAGHVYACTRTTKGFHWQADAYGRVTADLVADDLGVFAASQDLSLYLLDLYFGQVRWRARFSGRLDEAPVVPAAKEGQPATDRLVYQFCNEDGVGAVETAQIGVDERIRWIVPDGRKALTEYGDTVFLLGRDESLLAVQRKDGTVTEKIPAPGFNLGVPAIDDQTVYLVAADGRLFCARPLDVPPLSETDVIAAQLGRKPGEKEAAATTSQPAEATQPSKEEPSLLDATRQGKPIGGKSKISKQFGEGSQ